MKLYHEIHGSGAPVLLVHGFPLSGKLWEPVVPLLEGRFRLIVPDLRGHGRSEVSETVSMARFADDLAAQLDEIGESGPVVPVGMSMGGYVVFEFCRRYPERVRALVLADTRAQADPPEEIWMRREMAQLVRAGGSVTITDTMIARLFGPHASEELKASWREMLSATDPRGVAAALDAIACRVDSFATLSSLTCPVLIVTGEHDAITPPADAERMLQSARDARVEILAGAGHMTPVECPEAFAAVVLRFLDALD
jgi:3-oxoadipate enol-lactonase